MLLDFTLSRKRSFSLGRVNFIIHLSFSLSLSLFFPLARRIEHLALRFLLVLPVVDCPFVCRRVGFITTRRDERERDGYTDHFSVASRSSETIGCAERGEKQTDSKRWGGRKVFWYCLREPGRLIKYWILSMKYRRNIPLPPFQSMKNSKGFR